MECSILLRAAKKTEHNTIDPDGQESNGKKDHLPEEGGGTPSPFRSQGGRQEGPEEEHVPGDRQYQPGDRRRRGGGQGGGKVRGRAGRDRLPRLHLRTCLLY